MNRQSPRVSIGMPVYNGERFLADVLDSLLSQTFSDFELIISDNASTDKTQEICTTYAADDARIRYHSNESNLGAARNYNRVFELSEGEYFKWAAADDLCTPDYLKRCVEVLDSEADVVLCYPKTTIIDENGQILRKYEDGLNMVTDSASGRFIQTFYNCRLCNAVFGLIRSSKLEQTRLIKDFIASDKVLLAELSLLGIFREIPDYLFNRRFHIVRTGTLEADAPEYGASFVSLGKDKQLEWLNPAHKDKIAYVHWKLFGAYLTSIKRAPIRWSQKVFVMIFLFGTLIADKQYRLELGRAIRKSVRKIGNLAYSQEPR